MLFFLVFICLVCGFIFVISKLVKQWRANNSQPVSNIPAVVAAKEKRNDGDFETLASVYYITFDLQGGERIRFLVKKKDYMAVSEGDNGVLSSQGTRFLGFTKNM